jgi:hypothetical protein
LTAGAVDHSAGVSWPIGCGLRGSLKFASRRCASDRRRQIGDHHIFTAV